MLRSSLRRPFALFALALALFAALPCAALAGESSCCAAAAGCADANEAPCAQLAATPCCTAGGAPLEVTVSEVKSGTPPPACPIFRVEPLPELSPLASHVPPPLRGADITQRSVVLRL